MRILLLVLFISVSSFIGAQVQDTIFLWPENVGQQLLKPTILPDKGDGVIRITDVTSPLLQVFKAPSHLNKGVAMLVCPGGAFRHLSINKEGHEIAGWLNSIGINAFVLQYSVPEKRKQAVYDIQRAIRVVRNRANEWGGSMNKVGTIGFSAGGNLSAQVSQQPAKISYEKMDSIDNLSCIPDFALLLYPGGMGNASTKPGDLTFGKNTLPMFIFCTADDVIANYGSIYLTEKLYQAGSPVELHVLPEGGHGYGIRPSNIAARAWPTLAEKWLDKYVF